MIFFNERKVERSYGISEYIFVTSFVRNSWYATNEIGSNIDEKIVKVIDDFSRGVYPSTCGCYRFYNLVAVLCFTQYVTDGTPCPFYMWSVAFKFPPVINKVGFRMVFFNVLLNLLSLVFSRWYLACDRLIQLSSFYNVSLYSVDFIIRYPFISLVLIFVKFYLSTWHLIFTCVKWTCEISQLIVGLQ